MIEEINKDVKYYLRDYLEDFDNIVFIANKFQMLKNNRYVVDDEIIYTEVEERIFDYLAETDKECLELGIKYKDLKFNKELDIFDNSEFPFSLVSDGSVEISKAFYYGYFYDDDYWGV